MSQLVPRSGAGRHAAEGAGRDKKTPTAVGGRAPRQASRRRNASDRRREGHRVLGPVNAQRAFLTGAMTWPLSSPREAARVLCAPAGGRMLPIVQGLAKGRGDLPCARTLRLGEDLLLDLEVGPGVVVVDLGQRIGSVRGGLCALSPAVPVPASAHPCGGWRRARRARGSRGQTRLERSVLLREGIVPAAERVQLVRGELELLPVREDGGDGGARKIRRRRRDDRRRGRWRRGWRRGTAQHEQANESRRAHAWRETPALRRGCAGGIRLPGRLGARSMDQLFRNILAGAVLAVVLPAAPARA